MRLLTGLASTATDDTEDISALLTAYLRATYGWAPFQAGACTCLFNTHAAEQEGRFFLLCFLAQQYTTDVSLRTLRTGTPV